VLTLAFGGGVKVIRVCGIAERRGGAEEARQLYDEPQPDARDDALPAGG
jgi:ribosomal 50S subunit-recycling heat shock protein